MSNNIKKPLFHYEIRVFYIVKQSQSKCLYKELLESSIG